MRSVWEYLSTVTTGTYRDLENAPDCETLGCSVSLQALGLPPSIPLLPSLAPPHTWAASAGATQKKGIRGTRTPSVRFIPQDTTLTFLEEQVSASSSASVENVHRRDGAPPSWAGVAVHHAGTEAVPRHEASLSSPDARGCSVQRRLPKGASPSAVSGQRPSRLPGALCPAWHADAVVKGEVTGSFAGVSTQAREASHGLLSGEQKRIDVLEAFELRLVDPLYDVPGGTAKGGWGRGPAPWDLLRPLTRPRWKGRPGRSQKRLVSCTSARQPRGRPDPRAAAALTHRPGSAARARW